MAETQFLGGSPIGKLTPLRPHPQLYEINALAWLHRLGQQIGRSVTLSNAPETEWERLRGLGFDVIYLMGVWKRSPVGRRLSRSETSLFPRYDHCLPGWTLDDVAGSPFSIQGYEPDPEIGSWQELDALHRSLNKLGMRLVLDFIPNHTGPDHPWVREHPEYYIHGTLEQYRAAASRFFVTEDANANTQIVACGRDPNFAPWSDTAQLNYFDPGLRLAMIAQLRRIAEFCDGVRCDMAMLVLNDAFHQNWEAMLGSAEPPEKEFWQEAIAAIPAFLWIAEAYNDSEWALQQLGFNFTYDKRLYDRLRDGFVPDVFLHLKADWEFQSRSARFLENHDEERAAAAFGKSRLPAVAVLGCTIPGMHFLQEGQLEGMRTQLVVQLSHAQNEFPDADTRRIYERILRVANDDVFHSGNWKLLTVLDSGDHTQSDLIAYYWQAGDQVRLVVVNLGGSISAGRVYLPNEWLKEDTLLFEDLLDGATYPRKVADLQRWGLFVKKDAFGAHVLKAFISNSKSTMR